MPRMTKTRRFLKSEHCTRHKLLHKCLDELVADWIACDPDHVRLPSIGTVKELFEWSYQQTINPTLDRTPSGAFWHQSKSKRFTR